MRPRTFVFDTHPKHGGFDFKERKRVNRSATQVDVTYEVTIEESGERERANVTIALVKTNGKWGIARIDY